MVKLTPDISRLLRRHLRAARFGRASILDSLESLLTSDFRNAEVAILVRGSLARGDFCRYSDIDLVVLADNIETEVAKITGQRLQRFAANFRRRISVDFWDARSMFVRQSSLRFWIGTLEARFLAGNEKLFLASLESWRVALSRLSFQRLFELRRLDARRHWNISHRHSPLGMNIKRAEGGLVDGDFARLLRFLASGKSLCKPPCEALFRESRLIRAQLFVIKSLLHDLTGNARESAFFEISPSTVPSIAHVDNAAFLMERHQVLIEELERKLTC